MKFFKDKLNIKLSFYARLPNKTKVSLLGSLFILPPASLACDIKQNKRKKIQTTHPQKLYREIKPVITFLAISRPPKPHTIARNALVKLLLPLINSKTN